MSKSSDKKCKCKCEVKIKKDKKAKDKKQSCNRYNGFNACTTLPTLLVLQQSGLLCNDRAYILILLCMVCGGFGSGACGCDC